MRANTRKWLELDWDAVAGVVAAVLAIVLHFLHVVDEHVLLPILLALMALLFLNFMRHSRDNERTAAQVAQTAERVQRLQDGLQPSGVVLVGPRHLRSVNENFVRYMSGDSLWYNLCLAMYTPPPLFEALLRPALDNPAVHSLQFILDESQRRLWQEVLQPRLAACAGGAKVREPRWCQLAGSTSFILADSQLSGQAEALLSFWGEPFMSRATTQDIPRFIFHVQGGSELLPHLVELARKDGYSTES